MNIDNLNQLPYTPPKYYEDICKKKNRESVNCFIDPFYTERLEIYNSVYQEFQEQTQDIDDFDKRKSIMKKILHKTYRNYNNNLGFLPYTYFSNFKTNCFDEIQKDIDNNNKNCEYLFIFIDKHVRKDNNYIVDPFYSFVTLIDWITQEMIEDTSIPDKYILKYIQILIQKGYIGFNQYRFYLHVTILRRKKNDFLIQLIDLHNYFVDDLNREFIFKDGLKKCILRDLMKFAIINDSFKIVKLFIQKYQISLTNDVPEPLQQRLCNKKFTNYFNKNKNIKIILDSSNICKY